MDKIQKHHHRSYEEYARVLSFTPRARSSTIPGKVGIIVIALGETNLTLLEILVSRGFKFSIAERVYLRKEYKHAKIFSVLGKIPYAKIPSSARDQTYNVVKQIVTDNETKFIEYLNCMGSITSRVHALELIPGIGKMYMHAMLNERAARKFSSYDDVQTRVGLQDPVKHISERIVSELMGCCKSNLFVKR